jgi:protein-tyrosine phosphatase
MGTQSKSEQSILPPFLDIHAHFLPGVDDGPTSLQETIRMLRLAHLHGTRGIVATPHMFFELFGNYDVAAIKNVFDETASQLNESADRPELAFLQEIDLYLGAENYASPEFLKALDSGGVITLNGSRHLLVEFPLLLPASQILAILDRVLDRGLVPVIAHVERYMAVQHNPDVIARFMEMGCLPQVNADSFAEVFWSTTRRTVKALLDRDVVYVIASDGHSALRRPPDLSSAFDRLARKLPADRLHAMFVKHPALLVSTAS